MGNDDESDICGESFFEGFYSDTESHDGTRSIISASHGQIIIDGNSDVGLTHENQFSQLSYFNHSQQSGLQDFTTSLPPMVSERPLDRSDQNFEGNSSTTMTIQVEPSADIDQVRRQTDLALMERSSIATHWMHDSLTTLSDATADVLGENTESSKYHTNNYEDHGEGEAAVTWMIAGHGELEPTPKPETPEGHQSPLPPPLPSSPRDPVFPEPDIKPINISDEPTSFCDTDLHVSEHRPSLSFTRLTVSPASIQTIANTVAEVSGGFDIYHEDPEYKTYLKLSNSGRTSPAQSSQPVPNYDLSDTENSNGEDDTYSEEFSDVDSESDNGPPSLKAVRYSQLICINRSTKTKLTA